MEKLAAVDMGSNAVRLVTAELDKKGRLHVQRRIRVPLRLGAQTFREKKFSPHIIHRAEIIFAEFRSVMERKHITRHRAVATSAYRESLNADELGKRIFQASGITVEKISGEREAELIFNSVREKMDLDGRDFLLMDIGGGSLELTCVVKGEARGRASFDLGTVRLLEVGMGRPERMCVVLTECKERIERFILKFFPTETSLRVIGTGGNFQRILKLKRKIYAKNANHLTLQELENIHNLLERTPLLKRMKKFKLRPDRADVILPAMGIALTVLSGRRVKKILCPDAGLAHGVLLEMVGE